MTEQDVRPPATPLQGPVRIAPDDLQSWRTRVVWSDRVRLERLLRKWSQYDLAKIAGITQPQVSRLENGAKHVSNTVLVKVAAAFGERAGDLFPYADEIEHDPPARAG